MSLTYAMCAYVYTYVVMCICICVYIYIYRCTYTCLSTIVCHVGALDTTSMISTRLASAWFCARSIDISMPIWSPMLTAAGMVESPLKHPAFERLSLIAPALPKAGRGGGGGTVMPRPPRGCPVICVHACGNGSALGPCTFAKWLNESAGAVGTNGG